MADSAILSPDEIEALMVSDLVPEVTASEHSDVPTSEQRSPDIEASISALAEQLRIEMSRALRSIVGRELSIRINDVTIERVVDLNASLTQGDCHRLIRDGGRVLGLLSLSRGLFAMLTDRFFGATKPLPLPCAAELTDAELVLAEQVFTAMGNNVAAVFGQVDAGTPIDVVAIDPPLSVAELAGEPTYRWDFTMLTRCGEGSFSIIGPVRH